MSSPALSTTLGGVAYSVAVGLGILFLVLRFVSPSPRPPTLDELHFTDARTQRRAPFPSLADTETTDTVALSVVIPAYNEKSRLPTMVSEMLSYLEARRAKDPEFTYEVIVVDDGSKDGTSKVATEVAVVHAKAAKSEAAWSKHAVRVLTLVKNRGKGGAVTQGMKVARGRLLLFADADGATRFKDVELLEASVRGSGSASAVAVGSRAHMVSSEAVIKRSFVRNFLMHGFHTILLIVGIASIRDTQCGFKLLTREAGQRIFPNMHAEGWIFDIELLLIALSLGIPVTEVPVNWHEVEGTKMSLVRDSVVMLVDLLVIRLNYLLGLWKVVDTKKKNK
ncbi:dolichyl-phosphate beta-glucosyltransferase [Thoreauomyces humboldtii]|nr:dolichyl-phosphate beta-glucosyltransferase [Thoreauomyces humboldtii]